MDQNLKGLIFDFNSAQEEAVKAFEKAFECARPTSTDDYVFRCVPLIRSASYCCSGCHVRPHGIGMDVSFDGKGIDFDFGPNGEINVFDAWRLFSFAQRNKIVTSFVSASEIDEAIRIAMESGEISKVANGFVLAHNHSLQRA